MACSWVAALFDDDVHEVTVTPKVPVEATLLQQVWHAVSAQSATTKQAAVKKVLADNVCAVRTGTTTLWEETGAKKTATERKAKATWVTSTANTLVRAFEGTSRKVYSSNGRRRAAANKAGVAQAFVQAVEASRRQGADTETQALDSPFFCVGGSRLDHEAVRTWWCGVIVLCVVPLGPLTEQLCVYSVRVCRARRCNTRCGRTSPITKTSVSWPRSWWSVHSSSLPLPSSGAWRVGQFRNVSSTPCDHS